jgi:hypothetical protein
MVLLYTQFNTDILSDGQTVSEEEIKKSWICSSKH